MMGGGASFIEGTLSRVASINSGLLVCSIQLYMYTVSNRHKHIVHTGCIFFRWEPAPIPSWCVYYDSTVEDLTEDLDYVSKKCTSTARVPYSLQFPPPKLYQARGTDAEVQAEDLFLSRIRENPPLPPPIPRSSPFCGAWGAARFWGAREPAAC
jgi:hypothetical protein